MFQAKRALLSVSDKTGLVDFARDLASRGIELLSTGGSAKAIRDAGIAVTDVADVTGFPEIMGGRVKTLHPKIHGGILARRGTDESVMAEHGIDAIDLVVINLYPFEATINRQDTDLATAIENIDIGGPAMIRASAKNNASVLTVVDPADYASVSDALTANEVTDAMRLRFATKAFTHTANYDAAISRYLTEQSGSEDLGEYFVYGGARSSFLRYGENPHQQAAFYKDSGPQSGTLAGAELAQG
ncbi:MAG: bifunctional phosphoribosylaminoimidazolecarboxamide formyltransferase/IMP cyclohydrolase, partial [Pseudomonadota bacterium]